MQSSLEMKNIVQLHFLKLQQTSSLSQQKGKTVLELTGARVSSDRLPANVPAWEIPSLLEKKPCTPPPSQMSSDKYLASIQKRSDLLFFCNKQYCCIFSSQYAFCVCSLKRLFLSLLDFKTPTIKKQQDLNMAGPTNKCCQICNTIWWRPYC